VLDGELLVLDEDVDQVVEELDSVVEELDSVVEEPEVLDALVVVVPNSPPDAVEAVVDVLVDVVLLD